MKYNKVMLEEIETDILNAKYEQVAKKFKNMSDEEIHNIIYFNISLAILSASSSFIKCSGSP